MGIIDMDKVIKRIFGFAAVAFVFGNIAKYFRLKLEAEKALDRDIDLAADTDISLLGLLDSYGVPYSPEVRKSFMDYLSENLKAKGKLESRLDLYNLYVNKTWELDGIYENNVTIGELVKLQNFSLDFTRHKYGDGHIRSDLVYSCEERLAKTGIYEYSANMKHPVILYSCSANDLFYFYNMSLESINLKKIARLFRNVSAGLKRLQRHVAGNLDTLTDCNPNARIFVMGIYVPSDNFFLQTLGAGFIDRVNISIKRACKGRDNVTYVDVSCLAFAVLENDFHPNADGQYILAALLAQAVNDNLKVFRSAPIKKNKKPDKDKEKNSRKSALTAERFLMGLDKTDWPKKDYVEWAVAMERALLRSGLTDVSAPELEKLAADCLADASLANFQEEIQRAFEVMVIERKIHSGFDLGSYTLVPELVKNDKLSLEAYR